MTEKTKEKDPIEKAKAHITALSGFSEFREYLNSRQGHTAPAGDFLCAISRHITSLTKVIDELKTKIDPNEYYGTKCSECGWEGSSKFVRVHHYHDDCDTACPVCNSNDLIDLDKNISDEHSIQNLTIAIDIRDNELHEKISSLESQLSNREEEIKELKDPNKRLVDEEGEGIVEYQQFIESNDETMSHLARNGELKDEPNTTVYSSLTYGPSKWIYYTFDGESCTYFWEENEALASLQSKEGEG